MFDDILGPVDYEKQAFKDKLRRIFKTHYKQKIIRVELILYSINTVIKGCYSTGGPDIKTFTENYLLPLFESTDKKIISLSHIDYDSGHFYAKLEWS